MTVPLWNWEAGYDHDFYREWQGVAVVVGVWGRAGYRFGSHPDLRGIEGRLLLGCCLYNYELLFYFQFLASVGL